MTRRSLFSLLLAPLMAPFASRWLDGRMDATAHWREAKLTEYYKVLDCRRVDLVEAAPVDLSDLHWPTS